MEYGIRWTEVARTGHLISKEKIFRTRTARDHYANLIAEKTGFIRFDAWLDPPDAKRKTTGTT
jgi:hypothetical protein